MPSDPPFPDANDPRFICDELDSVIGIVVGLLLHAGYTPAQVGAKMRNAGALISLQSDGTRMEVTGAMVSITVDALDKMPPDVRRLTLKNLRSMPAEIFAELPLQTQIRLNKLLEEELEAGNG